MPTPEESRQQRILLLNQLARQNDPYSRQLSEELWQLYHAQQMAAVGDDVYLAATLPALPEARRPH